MKIEAGDFRKVNVSLIALLAMAGVGALSLHLSLDALKSARIEHAAARNERNAADGKLKWMRGEENVVKEESALFDALRARGIVGDEQRLEWVELLQDIADRRRLPDLHYEIAPRRTLDGGPGTGFTYHASAMTLQLGLLHEEDLTRLLADLRARASALIQVRSCNVSRLPPAEVGARSANLQANCLIDWITVSDGAHSEGKGR